MFKDIAKAGPKKVKILVDLKTVKQSCHLNVSLLQILKPTNKKSLLTLSINTSVVERVTMRMMKVVMAKMTQ